MAVRSEWTRALLRDRDLLVAVIAVATIVVDTAVVAVDTIAGVTAAAEGEEAMATVIVDTMTVTVDTMTVTVDTIAAAGTEGVMVANAEVATIVAGEEGGAGVEALATAGSAETVASETPAATRMTVHPVAVEGEETGAKTAEMIGVRSCIDCLHGCLINDCLCCLLHYRRGGGRW